MPTCPSCETENPADAVFCMACGARLGPATRVREVRKTVTVLFCDLVGSTTLVERHDPEVLRPVLQRYFEEMRAAIERHGGVVEKFIGDAVVAVFGMPQVHEDDALRAVRAAVQMRERLTSPPRGAGVELVGRIGITTGEVLVAGLDQPLIGDTMNTAARLQAAAEPGEILIGVPTYRLVQDAVVAEPVEPLALKGKSGLVRAYRLLQVASLSPMRTRRLDAPMVGRDREEMLLEQAFERTVSDGACQLFTVLGAAGAGKSRLVEEFLSGLGTADVMRGRCLPYGDGITYFPVAEAMKQALGLADFDDESSVREAIHAAVAEEDHGEAITANLAKILGAGEGGSAEETFWAIRRFLEVRGRERPVVAVFDDVHWGESTFLDLVEHVADWSRDASILLLCMARPDLLDVRPAWAGGKTNATTISLAPLSDAECAQLVDALLGSSGLPEDVRDRITGVAEGNPLFVEEMLRMLIDDELLSRDGERWVPSGELAEVSVPPTISALLSARLDRLSDEERALIGCAAVCGKEFHRGALVELIHEHFRPDVDVHLRSLVRKELVGPERSLLPGDDAYRFRHLLIRDAAYDAIPKQERAALHETFAAWLERVAGDRVAEQEEILGYHLEQAAGLRAELDPDDDRAVALARMAATHLTAAGRRAVDREDHMAGSVLLERAIALLPTADAERRALLPELVVALDTAGRFERADVVIRDAIEIGRSSGDMRLLNIASAMRVDGLLMRSPQEISLDEHRAVTTEAARVLTELGDDARLSEVLLCLGNSYWAAGQMEEVLSTAELALDAALRDPRVSLFQAIAYIHSGSFLGATPAGAALERMRGVLSRCAEERPSSAASLSPLTGRLSPAMLLAALGRFEEAYAELDEARWVVEELRNPWFTSFFESTSAFVDRVAGDPIAAETHSRNSTEGWRAGGVAANLVLDAGDLAMALIDLHREEEALALVEEHLPLAATWDLQPHIQLGTARVRALTGLGRTDEAVERAVEVEGLARTTGFVPLVAEALCAKAEALGGAGRGRAPEATLAAAEALRIFERKEFVPFAERTRRLLAELEP